MANNLLKMLIDEQKYYDRKGLEIANILNNTKIKGKTILDIGAGIGRLSFPLSKYAKKVVALDNSLELRHYFNKHKNRKVKFVNTKLENYAKKSNKFDIIILAWPTLNVKFLDLIKDMMVKNGKLICIIPDNNSDFETIVDKLDIINKSNFEEDIKNKEKFRKLLFNKFKLLSHKKIKTQYIFKNEKIAFNMIKNNIEYWFKIKLNKLSKEKLQFIINKHKNNKNIKFDEEVWFYIAK